MFTMNHKYVTQGHGRMAWFLVCVCFLALTTSMPAYAMQKTLPYYSMFEQYQSDNMEMSATAFENVMSEQHHVGSTSVVLCDDPNGNKASDCAENCSISTCYSSPSLSNALINWTLTECHSETAHQFPVNSSVLSRRSEPLFRPPIQ